MKQIKGKQHYNNLKLFRLSPGPASKPRIGINGMDRLGRLVLRSAVEAGLQVVAGNKIVMLQDRFQWNGQVGQTSTQISCGSRSAGCSR